MTRKGDAPGGMDAEQDTTTKRRYQRPRTPAKQRQTQSDDQQTQSGRPPEEQRESRREREPDWSVESDESDEQPDMASFGDGPTDGEVDLQTASREELEAMAFELEIDAYESMDRDELVSEIEERN